MSYLFNTKEIGVPYNEICRFNSFNGLITSRRSKWFKSEYNQFKEHTMPTSFFAFFLDVGKIQQTQRENIQPVKIK